MYTVNNVLKVRVRSTAERIRMQGVSLEKGEENVGQAVSTDLRPHGRQKHFYKGD